MRTPGPGTLANQVQWGSKADEHGWETPQAGSNSLVDLEISPSQDEFIPWKWVDSFLNQKDWARMGGTVPTEDYGLARMVFLSPQSPFIPNPIPTVSCSQHNHLHLGKWDHFAQVTENDTFPT